jgi:hypothetical protein
MGRHRATEVDGGIRFDMVEFIPSQVTDGWRAAAVVFKDLPLGEGVGWPHSGGLIDNTYLPNDYYRIIFIWRVAIGFVSRQPFDKLRDRMVWRACEDKP